MISKIIRPLAGFVRIANKSAISKSLLYAPCGVKFFSTNEKVLQAREKLASALGKEAKFEEAEYKEDESVKEFLKTNGFTLTDKANDINLELTKKVGDLNVSIQFQSRSPQSQEEEQEQQQQKEETKQEENKEQDEMQDYCDFSVYISKGDNKGLVFECSSFDSEISIHSVMLVKDLHTYKSKSKYERVLSEYNGPDFTTLDERLQTSFQAYLKAVGINEEVAAFIEHVSLDKEQRLYMQWLKDTKTFLE